MIWPYDCLARPPKPKLWIAVAPDRGWFLRINSEHRPGGVALEPVEHPFLEHRSWLCCHGELIEVDDRKLEDLLARQGNPTRRGVLGSIASSVRPHVLREIEAAPTLSAEQKEAILSALRAP